MSEKVEGQLERILAAVRDGRLVAPAGLVARLEGAVIAAKALRAKVRKS